MCVERNAPILMNVETLMSTNPSPAARASRTSLFKTHPTPWTYEADGAILDARGDLVLTDISSDDQELCDVLFETLVLVMNSYCPTLGALMDVQKFCQEGNGAVDPKVLSGIVDQAITTARQALDCHRWPPPRPTTEARRAG